ncbi:5944_t:CDS:2, partial [Cetraspora pellucida]
MLNSYEAYITDFNNSIEIESVNNVLLEFDEIDYYSLTRRANVYRILERQEEALEDLNVLLETDSYE